VERGLTRVYSRVDQYGVAGFFGLFFLYMCCVEFWVYWMHVTLHNPTGYKHLHVIHHKYNKENTLSPFAGLAFHWLDGVIQALPYAFMLFFVPCHFLAHELVLFGSGIWTTNIHDCLHANVMPVMGAGYHAIHHITYKHNHGHYFIYMDHLFGTLYSPEDFNRDKKGIKEGDGVAAASSKKLQ
jgi:lathosterol oxidase